MRPDRTDTHALRRALPQGRHGSLQAERLEELLERIAHKRTPTSSFARIWILGSLQAKVACGYLAYWLRSRWLDADEKQRLKNEAHLAAALQLLATMGYLRGAVMKVGQLLANLPEVVPEEFATVLAGLHFEAPPMHFAMVREVFLDELGREPEEVFASFDRRPFAAASLGQVHRARLHSGEEVAVKIQYPDIARTITSDLRNLRLLLQPLSHGRDWRDLLDKLRDVEQMLLQETDYRQEAAFLTQARALFSPADQVEVPQVFTAHSCGRVLTTAYLPGCHLGRFLEGRPSQEQRDHFTTLLTVATFRLYYRLHWLFADPHPGNFIFMPDGRLGLIDFGCTKEIATEDWHTSNDAVEATLAGDEARLDQALARACQFNSPQEMEPGRLAVIRQGFHWFMEPWLHEGLFNFGDREFFLRGIDNLVETARRRYTRSAPVTIWSSRFVIGGRAFCYRLQGRCRFRAIQQEEAAWLFHTPNRSASGPGEQSP
ncbi:MAG: ABC transporter [Desulfobulbaceae bacterium A2]|nr:MAG: ABC transporter [Desulfobulbaceae bacterium A2]